MTTNAVAFDADSLVGEKVGLRTWAVFAFAAWGFLATPAQAAKHESTPDVERDVFLSAVAEVETGGNARAIGRHGERGLYQFTRATWRRHSSRPFSDAHNPSVSHAIAVQHFDWLRAQIAASGHEPTPYRLAVAWNAGLKRAVSGSAPRSTRDYARRVTNLAIARQQRLARPEAAATTLVVAQALTNTSAATRFTFGSLDDAASNAPISFALGETSFDSVDLSAPEVIAVGPAAVTADEITFTLGNAAAPASSGTAKARRTIFATIGE